MDFIEEEGNNGPEEMDSNATFPLTDEAAIDTTPPPKGDSFMASGNEEPIPSMLLEPCTKDSDCPWLSNDPWQATTIAVKDFVLKRVHAVLMWIATTPKMTAKPPFVLDTTRVKMAYVNEYVVLHVPMANPKNLVIPVLAMRVISVRKQYHVKASNAMDVQQSTMMLLET
jgi:hypothetical protein